MKDIRTQFSAAFSEIRQAPGFKIIDINDDVRSEDKDVLDFMMRKIQKAGITFPPELSDIMDMNGIKIFWQYGDPVTEAGEFHLSSLNQALIYNDDRLWNDAMQADKIEIMKDFRIFDDHPGAGDARLAAFRLKDSSFSEIWYFNRGEIYLMDINYRKYLEATADLKGIIDWQYLFCKKSSLQNEYNNIEEELKRKLDFLSGKFSSTDYSKYYQLLDRM